MSTPKKRPGLPPSTEIFTEGVDPLVVQLRKEQVRQGLSNYRLGLMCGLSPQKLGQMWKGTAPTLHSVRKVLEALRKGNPKFTPTP
jgi:hypothetical protein